MLEVRALQTFYEASQALFGVDLDVREGEVVALLGRNGMGKTTTLNAIMGLIESYSGEVRIDGEDVRGWPTYRIARLGLGLVPEGRQIFQNLSVRENLIATKRAAGKISWELPRILNLFPSLTPRLDQSASILSGGEQQMLAIGRALLTNPRLLILDEATEGLSPLVREKIWKVVGVIRDAGIATIIVDKNVAKLMQVADCHYILEKGRIVFCGSSDTLAKNPDLLRQYEGV